jgi:hypothetical protein
VTETATEEETAHAGVETALPKREPARERAASTDVPVPLPRRSPSRSDAPGADQPPPLPPSWLERLRAAAEIGTEEETAHAGAETAPSKGEPARGSTASTDAAVPSPPWSPSRSDAPGPDEDNEAAGQSPSVPEQVLSDDPTTPVPVISETMHRDPVDSGAADIAAPHDARAPQNGTTHWEAPSQQPGTAPQDARVLWNGAAPRNRPAQLGPSARQWVDPATQERAGQLVRADEPAQEVWPADHGARRRPAVGRRLQITGVTVAVLTLTAAGALTMALYGHTAKAPSPAGRRPGASAPNAGAVTRDLAAAWVARQVNSTAVVSCDPVMCGALKSHGVPASDLDWLEPNTTSPLASAVIVATAAVRAQFGNILSSVYAPGVIARFGSGQLQIDIREIAPHGATAYRSALHADLIARRASGAGLLDSSRIAASATARRQLTAGQVDSRLIIMMAGLAAVHPIDIVAFGNVAPGGDLAMPLRFAEVTQTGRGHPAASRSASPAFLRSMIAFVRGQPAGLGVAQTQTVRLARGLTVLRIQFGAPSPLGLLGPHSP